VGALLRRSRHSRADGNAGGPGTLSRRGIHHRRLTSLVSRAGQVAHRDPLHRPPCHHGDADQPSPWQQLVVEPGRAADRVSGSGPCDLARLPAVRGPEPEPAAQLTTRAHLKRTPRQGRRSGRPEQGTRDLAPPGSPLEQPEHPVRGGRGQLGYRLLLRAGPRRMAERQEPGRRGIRDRGEGRHRRGRVEKRPPRCGGGAVEQLQGGIPCR